MTPPARRLEGLTGHGDLAIPPGRPLLIGRAASADLSIADQAVSRIHAEVESLPTGLRARDLGSANGTFVNGARIVEVLLQPGDVLTIGRPAFRLVAGSGAPAEAPSPPVRTLAPSDELATQPAVLRQLLAVAQSLSGCVDVPRLCEEIVERTFEVVAADRTALLVPRGPEGSLVPVASRNRIGEASAVQVPRAIAGRAAASGKVVLTESALEDAALQSGSVVAHRVRSAIAVPLLAGPGQVVGVLYTDRIAQLQPFTDADAQAALAFAGLAAISLARQETIETLQRQGEAQRNLERFFAPDVAAAIAAAGSPLAAGGERRMVTVLFSDIRGFTPLAEGMAPDAVAELLTEYFSAMAEAVFAHGGTLDKFLGDGLLAVWGAPLDAPGGSARALTAALAMRQEVAALNQAWTAAGRPPIGVGFGLARGEVFAGRIGSAHRLDYTVIGDVVNVAARLCKAAAADEILLTGAVRDDLTSPPGLARRPDLAVRGRSGPLEVWGA